MAKFQLNFFAITGHLCEDPVRTPQVSKTAVRFRLVPRSPFTDEAMYSRRAYFPPLDLYARGQQGDIVLRYHKGDYLTVWGVITSQQLNVRGKLEGFPILYVEGVDLLERLDYVPTAEELGFRVKQKKEPPKGTFRY